MSDAAFGAPPKAPAPSVNRERLVVLAVLGGIVALAISKGSIDRDTLIVIAVIVPSIILHEISHGAVANFFGDDTAKRAGRLTLNPLAHVDLFGTLIMPTALALSGLPPFGYAKPVPVNMSQLRHPRNEGLLVSLAGPATNYTLAGLAAVLFRVVVPAPGSSLELAIVEFGVLNLYLGTFNLLPIPPLDGSALLERLLPQSLWRPYLTFRRYSMLLVFIVVFQFHGVLDAIYDPLLHVWGHLAGLHF